MEQPTSPIFGILTFIFIILIFGEALFYFIKRKWTWSVVCAFIFYLIFYSSLVFQKKKRRRKTYILPHPQIVPLLRDNFHGVWSYVLQICNLTSNQLWRNHRIAPPFTCSLDFILSRVCDYISNFLWEEIRHSFFFLKSASVSFSLTTNIEIWLNFLLITKILHFILLRYCLKYMHFLFFILNFFYIWSKVNWKLKNS